MKCECGKQYMEPFGSDKNKILIVIDSPDFEDTRAGKLFQGRYGEVLINELKRAGIEFSACRFTSLWKHAKDEKTCEVTRHLDMLVKEFKGKSHILLMGADTSKSVADVPVSDYAGLRVDMPEFPKSRIWIAPSPGSVFHMPIGDLRLAFKRFGEDIREHA